MAAAKLPARSRSADLPEMASFGEKPAASPSPPGAEARLSSSCSVSFTPS